MADRRTFASVTDTACTCGYLQRAADDPRLPIVFDPQTGEFHFTYREPGSQGPSTLVIYHCPFCGGAAPQSKRHLLFAAIPPEEEDRLSKLLASVKTIRSALKRLGKPERDDPSGTRIGQDEADGNPPVVQHHRTLIYERLSEVADVCITERADGGASWQLIGKYVAARPSGGST
ncbi:MAG: hypothetical protein ACHRHE_18640 [Tepidisphaerales bacterium]